MLSISLVQRPQKQYRTVVCDGHSAKRNGSLSDVSARIVMIVKVDLSGYYQTLLFWDAILHPPHDLTIRQRNDASVKRLLVSRHTQGYSVNSVHTQRQARTRAAAAAAGYFAMSGNTQHTEKTEPSSCIPTFASPPLL